MIFDESQEYGLYGIMFCGHAGNRLFERLLKKGKKGQTDMLEAIPVIADLFKQLYDRRHESWIDPQTRRYYHLVGVASRQHKGSDETIVMVSETRDNEIFFITVLEEHMFEDMPNKNNIQKVYPEFTVYPSQSHHVTIGDLFPELHERVSTRE